MKVLPTVLFIFLCTAIQAQNFNTMTGDWIRVQAEYADGQRLPNNHYARVYQRYRFTKDEVYQVIGNTVLPSSYTRTGNDLKIGPAQRFMIEEYTDKSLRLVEAQGNDPARFYLIPIDSFQRMGFFKYAYTVVNADTIYTMNVGIEPIYPKGSMELLEEIMQGFTVSVSFEYSYVVRKDGTIGEVEVLFTTNDKRNKRLIQMVQKSSGKWIPATWRGKAIDVKITSKMGVNK